MALVSRVLKYPATNDVGVRRALAVAWMSLGEVEPAVREIRLVLGVGPFDSVEAAINMSSDPSLLVDATAIHYARYEQRHEPEDLFMALTVASRAYELAPQMPEAVWNHAFLLDELGLIAESRRAWTDYLRVDARSGWADEARERRSRLPTNPLNIPDPSRNEALLAAQSNANPAIIRGEDARSFRALSGAVLSKWIPDWADAVLRDDPSASIRLRAIAIAGEAVRERTTDTLISSFAASAAATRRFARPHAQLARVSDVETAETILRELRAVRSPMATSFAVRIAAWQYNAGHHREALARLDELEPDLPSATIPLTAAQAEWVRGVALTSLGRVRPAAASYHRLMKLYAAVGDVSQVGPINLFLADNAELAGEFDEMWTRDLIAVRESERNSQGERIWLVLGTMSRRALRHGHSRVAAVLNNAMLERTAGAPPGASLPYRAQGLLTKCELLARQRKFEQARAECAAARQAWEAVASPTERARLEADLETATAAVDRMGNVDALTRAVEVSTERHDLYRLSRLLLLRGRTYRTQGAMSLAESDLERSLAVLEEQRHRLDAINDKVAYFETSRGVAEELIRLFVEQGRTDDALEIVERVRARALVDRLTVAASRPSMAMPNVLKTIPPGEALLIHWCDSTEIYAWVLTRERVVFRRRTASRTGIAAAARRFASSLSPNAGDFDPATDSELLYDALIAPVTDALAGIDTITFVPDIAFAGVPYSALRSRRTGRYVVQDYAVARAASATAYALRPPPAAPRSVLMIMNPRTEDLATLEVDAEIRAAASVFPRSAVFTRDTATETALTDFASDHPVLHVAAHGIDDAFGEPALALTPDSTNDGTLNVTEVEKLRLRRGALVILASCGSAKGRTTSEGVLSLARAFIAAGARSIVAALWDADDRDSGRLLGHFYSALQAGKPVAHALRHAQLDELKNPRTSHPRHWAAYQIEGGS